MPVESKIIKEALDRNLPFVRPNTVVKQSLSKIIKPMLSSGIPIEGFLHQVTKSASGLALEMLIFDRVICWDIVVSNNKLDYCNIFIKDIKACLLSISPILNAESQEIIDHKINLKIFYGEKSHFNYNSNITLFDEILAVKDKLNNIIRG